MEYCRFMKMLHRSSVFLLSGIKEGEAIEYVEAKLMDDNLTNENVKKLYGAMKKSQKLIKTFISSVDKKYLDEFFIKCRQMDWVYPTMIVDMSPMVIRVKGLFNDKMNTVELIDKHDKVYSESVELKNKFYKLGLSLESINIEIGVVNIVNFNFTIDNEYALDIVRNVKERDVIYTGTPITIEFVGY